MKKYPFLALAALPLVIHAQPAEKSLLWGDTHVHTNLSTDSYINQNFDLGPDAAYRFARGLPVIHPTTGHRVQIQTPLDFLVVADHAGPLGTMKAANTTDLPREGLNIGGKIHSWLMERLYRYLASEPDSVIALLSYAAGDETDIVKAALNPPAIATPNNDLIRTTAWEENITAADANNRPGEFSALIGFEWTSIPAGANLHRVVFTDGDAKSARQYLPFSAQENTYPEGLWQWLDQTAASTGSDFVSIPHNSNISRGTMFPAEARLNGASIDLDWINLRARWERVVEATQIKGDSETHPLLSPGDPFADFEGYPHYIMANPVPYNPRPADFVRGALRTGLQLEAQFGSNPYRFGLIGSTDSHTSMATAEEPNFWGKFPTDSIPRDKSRSVNRIKDQGWVMSAQGLAAAWSEDNTREAILAAFKRGEVYATTGPRIAVKVMAGDSAAETEPDTPMGGALKKLIGAPIFKVEAARDPKSGALDRIQMIKGWMDGDGETHERVIDIAWAGERTPDSDGFVPALPDTVSREDAGYSDEHGAATLSVSWQDPLFDPTQPAFYYVRVLETHTPRHSTFDAIAMGIDPETLDQPVSIQERAYTSPIHYDP